MKKVLMITALMLAAAIGWAQSPRAIIRELQGTVEIKPSGSQAWLTAVEGQELEQETLVSTGFKSTALLDLGGSTLRVRPLTQLSLGEIQAAADTDRININLRTGRVRANVRAPAGSNVEFTVRSPIATASVRGTVFDFDTINLRVDEGTVSFSGTDNTAVHVAAGQSSSPDPASGRAAAPVETAAARTPPPPAGVAEAAASPAEVIPAPAPGAPVNVGFNWED
jgi:hypothetical protein